MRTNTFANLKRQCEIKGVICEKSRGKIELTTPDGGTTAERLTVAEAMETLHGDSTFSSLPIKLAKTSWQRQMEAEAKASIRITPLQHLRAISAQIYRCGSKTDADAILTRVQQAEAELEAVVNAARNLTRAVRRRIPNEWLDDAPLNEALVSCEQAVLSGGAK